MYGTDKEFSNQTKKEQSKTSMNGVQTTNSYNPHEIFIRELYISNFKGFKACEKEDYSDGFCIAFETPNGTVGSGLTVLLGDNNCGKTTILDAVNLVVLRSNAGLCAKQYIYNDIRKDIKVVFRMTSGAVCEKTVSCAKAGYILDPKTGNTFVGGTISKTTVHSYFDSPRNLYEEDKRRFGYFWDRVYNVYKEHREKMVILEKIQTDLNCLFQQYMDRRDFTIPSQVGGIGNYVTGIEKGTGMIEKHLQTDDEHSKIFHILPSNLTLLSERCVFDSDQRLKIEQEKKYDTSGNGALIFSSIKEAIKRRERHRPGYYEKNIFLIDEPEEGLHPCAVTKLVEFLCDTAKTCQIILTTHSLQIVEDVLSLLRENNQKEPEKHFRILTKENGKNTQTDMNECLLRYISANEINYVAFNRTTAGYYVELFEEIKGKYIPKTDKKIDAFFEKVTEAADIDGKGMNYRINRNHIVHDERHQIAENTKMTFADFLVKGISDLRGVLKYIKTHPEQYPEIKKEDKD